MKTCPQCKTAKPPTEYHKCTRSKDGLKSWCKTCCCAKESARRKESPDKCYASIKNAKAKKPDKYRSLSNKWRREHPEQSRGSLRRDAEKIGDTYLRRLLVAQGFGSFRNIPSEVLKFKRQQILIRRLARQLKKAANESSKNTG